MTRGGTRSIAVLAATALVALLFAACGSSDSGSSDSGSSGDTAATETNAQNGTQSGGSHGENDAGEGPQEQSGGGKKTTGFSVEEVETPLKVSAGGSEQFQVKGGDNSIQEFGEERDESELQEAAEAVHGFFVARAVGDWKGACSYLSKSMIEQLEQLAASSTQLKDKGCASFLEAFTTELSAAEWRAITTVDAGSLRQEGEQGFLIYYGPEKATFAMPLKEEDGSWKVGALSGDELG